MNPGQRRPWLDTENARLIELWFAVGSVTLIALMMDRTPSSVQTRASRLNLPARSEGKDRHRRRWDEAGDAELDAALAAFERADGMIPIVDVAARAGRSVDAVVERLLARMGKDSGILGRLVVPPRREVSIPVREGGAKAGTKRCLKCRGSFWSQGNHNWVCDDCKRPGSDWDFD